MWIRNQDGKQLVNITNIYEVEGCIYTDDSKDGYSELGKYESSERAVEVLDMIHQHINNYQYSIITGEHYVSKIFVMPIK